MDPVEYVVLVRLWSMSFWYAVRPILHDLAAAVISLVDLLLTSDLHPDPPQPCGTVLWSAPSSS
jgi:hypothetical protein